MQISTINYYQIETSSARLRPKFGILIQLKFEDFLSSLVPALTGSEDKTSKNDFFKKVICKVLHYLTLQELQILAITSKVFWPMIRSEPLLVWYSPLFFNDVVREIRCSEDCYNFKDAKFLKDDQTDIVITAMPLASFEERFDSLIELINKQGHLIPSTNSFGIYLETIGFSHQLKKIASVISKRDVSYITNLSMNCFGENGCSAYMDCDSILKDIIKGFPNLKQITLIPESDVPDELSELAGEFEDLKNNLNDFMSAAYDNNVRCVINYQNWLVEVDAQESKHCSFNALYRYQFIMNNIFRSFIGIMNSGVYMDSSIGKRFCIESNESILIVQSGDFLDKFKDKEVESLFICYELDREFKLKDLQETLNNDLKKFIKLNKIILKPIFHLYDDFIDNAYSQINHEKVLNTFQTYAALNGIDFEVDGSELTNPLYKDGVFNGPISEIKQMIAEAHSSALKDDLQKYL